MCSHGGCRDSPVLKSAVTARESRAMSELLHGAMSSDGSNLTVSVHEEQVVLSESSDADAELSAPSAASSRLFDAVQDVSQRLVSGLRLMTFSSPATVVPAVPTNSLPSIEEEPHGTMGCYWILVAY